MTILDSDDRKPPKKGPRPPKIYTNTYTNICRSIERLARWVMKADVTEKQVSKARASKGFMQIRVDLERILVDRERLELARDRFTWERRIDERLTAIEDALDSDRREAQI